MSILAPRFPASIPFVSRLLRSPQSPNSTNMATNASEEGPYYAITGIPVADDSDYPRVGVRQNIDQWSDNPDNEKQVNLFVMALDRFQKIDPTKRDSYFQIAGIHGQPNVAWDETLSPEEQATIKGKSYCTHNTILFPVWHRPYLALYEQRLYEIMTQDIIPNFPEENRKEWSDAAYNWRLPFWDWAIANEASSTGTVKVPKLSKYPTITVPTADGKGTERIDNPLYQFKMPNNKPMREHGVQEFTDPWGSPDELDYGRTIGTSRHPDDEDAGITAVKALNDQNNVVRKETEAWKHGVVNNSGVEKALSKPEWNHSEDTPEKLQFGKAAEAVYRLLTVPMEYSTFATTASVPSKETENNDNVTGDLNIEFIHNAIHGFVGGDNYGHMSQIPVASFDPLFWLHHCNIDRIFALWQGLNPEKWFEEGLVYDFAAQDILGLPVNTKINNKTPLRPFHADSKGRYLTAEDVRSTGMLGYTYPELRTFQPKYHSKGRFDLGTFIKDLITEVNRLYGESRELLLGSDGKIKGVDPVDGGMKSLDYAFSIRYKKYAFGGEPFWVKLYLANGDEPNIKTDSVMAEIFNFSQKPELADGQVACANCKDGQKNDAWATAYISITPLLAKLIKESKKNDTNKLTTMKQGEVLHYLRKNAYWRIIKQDGKVAASYDVEKVDPQIIGSTNDATTWNDITKAPKLENFQPQPDISGSGADGGFNPAHKQPISTPPPFVPRIPNAKLQVDKSLPFKQPVTTDGVVIIRSSKLDLQKATLKEKEIDNTQITLRDKDDNIIFLISIRRAEGTIHFNTLINNSWGKAERVSLDNRFKTNNPTILLHDQGDGYEIFIDWVHVLWFEKQSKAPAESITYGVNRGQNPVWGNELDVQVYSSFKELFSK